MAKKKKGYDELGEGVLNYLGAYGSPASSAGGSDEQMGSQDSIGGLAELLMQLSPVLGMVTGKGDGGGVMDTIGGIGIGGKALQKASSGGKSGGLGSLSKMFS